MYHHYLVIEVHSDSVLIIHNVGSKALFFTGRGFAKVQENKIKFVTKGDNPDESPQESEHLDFNAGVYLIERPGYPTTDDVKDQVIKKARSRVGETDYKLSSNNCEFFVTWAITGFGTCKQLEDAGQLSRSLADVVDSTACNYRSAFVKTVVDKGVQSSIIGIEKAVTTNVLHESSKFMVKTAATATSRIATGAVAAVAVVPIEAATCAFGINSLHNKMKKGKIDKRTFKREVTKNVSGSAAAAGAGIGGAVIGQVLIPIPIAGGIIGGVVGGLIGRVYGSVVSGAVYDIVD